MVLYPKENFDEWYKQELKSKYKHQGKNLTETPLGLGKVKSKG